MVIALYGVIFNGVYLKIKLIHTMTKQSMLCSFLVIFQRGLMKKVFKTIPADISRQPNDY